MEYYVIILGAGLVEERIRKVLDLQLYLFDLEEKLRFETSIFNRQFLEDTIVYIIAEIDDIILRDRGDDDADEGTS